MLQPGQRLGDFEIVRFLGKGGMGVVYEARQSHPPRPVALKVLADWLANDEAALQRFWREVEVLALLDHPGIVRIIASGRTPEGIAYYAMQLIRGVSLHQLIHWNEDTRVAGTVPFPNPGAPAPTMPDFADAAAAVTADFVVGADAPPPIVLDYQRQRYATLARLGALAARALAAAHTHPQKFIHRDVKPRNVMVDLHGQLYVMDFGLTRALDADGQSTTQAGLIRGTPWYMSPEQALGDKLDHRTDIFSLGVTLYELATQGLGPYTADRHNTAAVLDQVRRGDHLPLRLLAPEIPPRLGRVIERAMQRSPRRRYQSAEALAKELDELAGQSETLAPPPRRALPARWLWLTQLTAGQWTLVAVVMAVLLLLGGGAGALLYGLNRPTLETPAQEVDPSRWESLVPAPRLKHPIPLLLEDANPLWHRMLAGTGSFQPDENLHQLILNAPNDETFTVLALANETRADTYQFSVDLMAFRPPQALETEHHLGIFFGWRRADDGGKSSPRFFVVHLEDRPSKDFPNGHATLGTGQIIEAAGGRAASEHILPLVAVVDTNGKPGIIPLAKAGGWHHLRVRCDSVGIELRADNLEARSFQVHQARKQELPGSQLLDTRGAVGIWAHRGNALAREPQLIVHHLRPRKA
jgi:serine/threonine protein kinase